MPVPRHDLSKDGRHSPLPNSIPKFPKFLPLIVQNCQDYRKFKNLQKLQISQNLQIFQQNSPPNVKDRLCQIGHRLWELLNILELLGNVGNFGVLLELLECFIFCFFFWKSLQVHATLPVLALVLVIIVVSTQFVLGSKSSHDYCLS